MHIRGAAQHPLKRVDELRHDDILGQTGRRGGSVVAPVAMVLGNGGGGTQSSHGYKKQAYITY